MLRPNARHRSSARAVRTATRSTSQESNNKPLAGDKFWEGFTQKTVGDLLTFVSTSMPNGNGGSLAAATYNDLVALILKSNGFPAGTAELAPETVANVQIIPKEGPGELPANTLVRSGRLSARKAEVTGC